MTAFQKKTLKHSCTILLEALGIAVVLIGLTLFIIWKPYIAIGAIVAAVIVYGLVIPAIKDWKLRGKLTEDEYGIYTYYKKRCGYISEETIIKELAHWNGITLEQVQEIIAKVGEK